MRILIMGLPGSGKTTLARKITEKLNNATWLNADLVRTHYNDWDFSEEGRIRQAHRMRELADKSTDDYVIVDFVAPLPQMRDIFGANITIWMDTISNGRYNDTNKMFVPPEKYDFRVTEKNCELWADRIVSSIIK